MTSRAGYPDRGFPTGGVAPLIREKGGRPESARARRLYWSGTEYAGSSQDAWIFHADIGSQVFNHKDLQVPAWAVRPGQVAAVPLPAALPLMGVGLLQLGLLGWWQRRRRLVLRRFG